MEGLKLTSRADTEALLSSLNIPFKTEFHREIFTVKEGLSIFQEVKGEFLKNLFMKDKKGKFYLLTAIHSTETSFKKLQSFLPGHGGGIRQASEELLPELLGVTRGAVTPFALVNDPTHKVQFLLDKNVLCAEKVLVHPMENTSTMELLTTDLVKFLQHIGRESSMKVLDFSQGLAVPKEEQKKEDDKTDDRRETKLKISVSKQQNFSQWYSEVLTKGQMIEYYDISGCYIIRPWAYEIWERIQSQLNSDIKSLGVQNSYFPLFVSNRALNTEKAHIEGFAPEVAWVTRSGQTELREPIAVRPTSETIMYPAYAKWIRSYRDLPLKLNQWCNVVRWEFKHPTPFLRTREFLWQEGHTAHQTFPQAEAEVYQVLEFYAKVYEELLAVPVIKGKKSELEKFAGGLFTTTVETMISANGRGIQGATSHCLGQNFSKMFGIEFEDVDMSRKHVWQNSWGLTTRTIGVMVMVHGDDKGLVLPPRVASVQVVVIPIRDQTVDTKAKANEICETLKNSGVRAKLDDRDNVTAGWKYNHWELLGVPLRLEIGAKDINSNSVRVVKRHNKQVLTLDWDSLDRVKDILEEIQHEMYVTQKETLQSRVKNARDWDEFLTFLNAKNLVLTPWCERTECEESVKQRSGTESQDTEATGAAKTLCMPLEQEPLAAGELCFSCGQLASTRVLWGRSY